jgi:hypothetical protein
LQTAMNTIPSAMAKRIRMLPPNRTTRPSALAKLSLRGTERQYLEGLRSNSTSAVSS